MAFETIALLSVLDIKSVVQVFVSLSMAATKVPGLLPNGDTSVFISEE